jgi:hypothetical protein
MEGRMDSKIIGEFDLVPDELVPEAQLSLTLSPSELTAHWLRCGQVSDFVAGYIASAYAAEHRAGDAPLFTAISTVFQELIENAAKFSRKREATIGVTVKHFSRILMFEITNVTTPAFAQRFEEYLEQMSKAVDLGAVYLDIVEAQTESSAEALRSGIGLLVLRKDHEVRLGVKFSHDAEGRPTITVRAVQTLEDV